MRIHAFADEASPSLAGQITAMKRNGLQGVEMRNVDGGNATDLPLARAREIRKILADEGLCVWALGSPIGKIAIDSDAAGHAAHLDRFRHALEVTEALGSRRIRMFSYYIPQNDDPAAWKQAVLDRMGELLRAAEGSGILLCHENEKGIYGDNAARCAELLGAMPELHAVFDPANFVQCGQDTWEAWELLRDRIDYLHIKDALASGEVVPAGKGIGHVKEITADWIARGGDAATIEPHLRVFDGLAQLERGGERSGISQSYPTPDAAFDAACAAFRAILG